MNLKGFFVEALSGALDLGMASPDDVLRHVTPDILAVHLPRPLWARLLTACLGAPRVDAQLVVETIGVANLCEHVPTAIIWNVISEIALRSLGREFVPLPIDATIDTPNMSIPTSAPMSSLGSGPVLSRPAPLAMTPPPAEKPREPTPPPKPVAVGPAIPSPTTPAAESLADVVAALESEERTALPARTRTPTSQRFRQTNTGIGRLAQNNARRPQASAPAEPPPARNPRRGATEVNEYAEETNVGQEDWKNTLAVEEGDQYVEWPGTSSEETATTDEYGRKR